MANVGNVFIKRLQTFFYCFTFFTLFNIFYLHVYYIYALLHLVAINKQYKGPLA